MIGRSRCVGRIAASRGAAAFSQLRNGSRTVVRIRQIIMYLSGLRLVQGESRARIVVESFENAYRAFVATKSHWTVTRKENLARQQSGTPSEISDVRCSMITKGLNCALLYWLPKENLACESLSRL